MGTGWVLAGLGSGMTRKLGIAWVGAWVGVWLVHVCILVGDVGMMWCCVWWGWENACVYYLDW